MGNIGFGGEKRSSSFSFSGSNDEREPMGFKISKTGSIPLVISREGSQYFDEDGDLAHEFYEEVIPKHSGGRRRMRKISSKQLTPEGEVKYAFPCLHVDFPIVMYQD